MLWDEWRKAASDEARWENADEKRLSVSGFFANDIGLWSRGEERRSQLDLQLATEEGLTVQKAFSIQ
ncbi:hypothetical protein BH23CYA1_BH23CYA1_07660 [soil metagenome]